MFSVLLQTTYKTKQNKKYRIIDLLSTMDNIKRQNYHKKIEEETKSYKQDLEVF